MGIIGNSYNTYNTYKKQKTRERFSGFYFIQTPKEPYLAIPYFIITTLFVKYTGKMLSVEPTPFHVRRELSMPCETR